MITSATLKVFPVAGTQLVQAFTLPALDDGLAVMREQPSLGIRPFLARRFDFSTVENLLATEGGCAETIEVAPNWSDISRLHVALKEALAPYADEVLAHFSHVYTQATSMYVILLGSAPTDAEALERLVTAPLPTPHRAAGPSSSSSSPPSSSPTGPPGRTSW